MAHAEAPVVVRVNCAHCRGAIDLECEGLSGFNGYRTYTGYRTYNEYSCPHCRKQNHQLSAGAILSARVSGTLAKPDFGKGSGVS